jgi:hypothetical protein
MTHRERVSMVDLAGAGPTPRGARVVHNVGFAAETRAERY